MGLNTAQILTIPDTDSDIDDELDIIYRNEAIDDSMEMFGFGDDGDGDDGDW